MLEVTPAGRPDQAAGLRRIFRAPGVRVLPILAPEIAPRRLLALAQAIAATGERVLVLDQGDAAPPEPVPGETTPRATLADLVAGRADFDGAATVVGERVRWLLAGGGFESLEEEGMSTAQLWSAFGALPEPIDVVLLRATRVARLGRLVDRDGECLLVTSASDACLAAAYGQLKVAASTKRHVRVLVDGAPHESLALRTYKRIATTAERFLGVVPRLAGWLPTESIRSGPTAAAGGRTAPGAIAKLAQDLAGWRLAEFHAEPDAVRGR